MKLIDTGWQEQAVCNSKKTNPEDFFSDIPTAQKKLIAEYCAECPVINSCLAYALENKIEFGIWGGMTTKGREILLSRSSKLGKLSLNYER